MFFPGERKTEALEIDIIKGASNLPVSAKVHAFDTEANRIQGRRRRLYAGHGTDQEEN